MREILFKGKRVDNGEWIEGFYCPVCFGYFPCRPAIVSKEEMDNGCWRPVEVDPETIVQYTGLTDKNGEKIFDGDIIKASGCDSTSISVVRYGEYQPRMFYDLLEKYVFVSRPKELLYGLYCKSIKGEKMFLTNGSKIIEIIGNIYDNPELLGGAEE